MTGPGGACIRSRSHVRCEAEELQHAGIELQAEAHGIFIAERHCLDRQIELGRGSKTAIPAEYKKRSAEF